MPRNNRKAFGVGITDVCYKVAINEYRDGKLCTVWKCKYYQVWYDMLRRCYSDKFQNDYPSYLGCEIAEEWLTFSNFKAWMEQQDWEGKHLDKDLLVLGNKKYSPETCMFIHPKINSFVLNCGKSRNKLTGTCYCKVRDKYRSTCSNPFTNKTEFLGYFTTELEAHLTWKSRKHELACLLADSEYCTDPRLAEALRTRYAD